MPERAEMFQQLCGSLRLMRNHSDAEILYDDRMGVSTGFKRNSLLAEAKGDYIVFADDDDEVDENYIPLILSATEHSPDCVGIQGMMTTNGKNPKQWYISKEHKTWHENNGIYYRTPNHISPVRKTIALQVGFPDISFGEDYQYSMGILPLLQTEIKIEKNIYHYKFVHK
jgi:glycosyltransferase involved in cell wall biosynthesis